MMHPAPLRLIPLALAISACSARQAAVPVVGPAAEVHALAGKWSGEYSSAESGRSGSISFTLRAADDSAFGDVVMIPSGTGRPLAPWTDALDGDRRAPAPQVLTIRFVGVENGHIRGTLTPYRDPETGVRLVTRFSGELAGDTIEGSYTTQLPSGMTQTGRWKVTRASSY